MKDGKIYFLTDLSVGCGPIGSQIHLNNIINILSSPSGVPSLDSMETIFPEEGNVAWDSELNSFIFDSKSYGDDFEIAFPRHSTQNIESDDENEFTVTYKNTLITSMSTKAYNLDGDFSAKEMKNIIRSACVYRNSQFYKCLAVPQEYTGDNIVAFYLPILPTSLAYIARPDGFHTLYVEWNLKGGLPSKNAVCNFFEKWLSTYKYLGKKQYSELLPLDRDEMLKTPVNKEVENKLLAEFEDLLNRTNHQIDLFKVIAGSKEKINKPTQFFIYARQSLAEAAAVADEIITQATNVIHYYKAKQTDEGFIDKLYSLSYIALGIASDINTTIKINSLCHEPLNNGMTMQ